MGQNWHKIGIFDVAKIFKGIKMIKFSFTENFYFHLTGLKANLPAITIFLSVRDCQEENNFRAHKSIIR